MGEADLGNLLICKDAAGKIFYYDKANQRPMLQDTLDANAAAADDTHYQETESGGSEDGEREEANLHNFEDFRGEWKHSAGGTVNIDILPNNTHFIIENDAYFQPQTISFTDFCNAETGLFQYLDFQGKLDGRQIRWSSGSTWQKVSGRKVKESL